MVEFTRPHTIIGTTLAVCVLYALSAASAGRQDWVLLASTLVASLSVNLYIVGLNQLTDIEIDRINKPYLPLAAGTLKVSTALVVVIASGILSLAVAALQGRFLFGTIATIFLIGTAYSLPPLRLKRFPFYAAASITIARALVLNVGLCLTYSTALAGHPSLPSHISLFVGFMLAFVIVIAIMKDVPDIDGDRQNQIATLVLQLGAPRTMLLCRSILTLSYLAMIGAGLAGVRGVHGGLLVTTHVAALAAVWLAGARTEDSKDSIYRYYMFIWKLFYFEFFAFPAACLLAIAR
jgi:homogentisate phytyltransferase/homogentisate geranylgeranyltransferase